ncbi:hypothetical protein CYMTET_7088 [Cymbomonas tetramitiformis]|uniref:DDE-1 domain-containing protein n=1 Tax=Cymbomonas tetramitiformis TaxID=36881 RepID=A0AAE0GW58_9CHLO|nr:hypothetical protein CYMTET_7088 [Cymbomonas tetramitiformis]
MRARKLAKVVRAEMAAKVQEASVNAEDMRVRLGEDAPEEGVSTGEETLEEVPEDLETLDKRLLSFRARKDWRRRFCKRFHIARRRRTNNKGKSKGDRAAAILKWHRDFFTLLLTRRRPNSNTIDEKWGRFLPTQRVNVDQSPLGFISGLQDTYTEKGSKEVWINTPSGISLEKRQCTLQVCYAADARGGVQCRLALIFRGLGQRITALEKESWDDRVDVYFQPNAWADREFCLNWLGRTYGPWAEAIEGEKILLMDNLDGQVHLPFRTECKEKWNTLAWYFSPNCTDLLQPVDRHFAQYLKTLIAAALEQWLEDDNNLAKWESGQFTASERRILLTHWCGQAWEKVSKMHDFAEKSFKGSGCLLTVDMSELKAVAPQNVPGYSKLLAAELRKVRESETANQGEVQTQEVPEHVLPSVEDEKSSSSDGGENGLDTDNEADVISGSDEEEATAPFFVPAGMRVMGTMPALDKKLVKTAVLFKWVAHRE